MGPPRRSPRCRPSSVLLSLLRRWCSPRSVLPPLSMLTPSLPSPPSGRLRPPYCSSCPSAPSQPSPTLYARSCRNNPRRSMLSVLLSKRLKRIDAAYSNSAMRTSASPSRHCTPGRANSCSRSSARSSTRFGVRGAAPAPAAASPSLKASTFNSASPALYTLAEECTSSTHVVGIRASTSRSRSTRVGGTGAPTCQVSVGDRELAAQAAAAAPRSHHIGRNRHWSHNKSRHGDPVQRRPVTRLFVAVGMLGRLNSARGAEATEHNLR